MGGETTPGGTGLDVDPYPEEAREAAAQMIGATSRLREDLQTAFAADAGMANEQA